MRDQCKLTLDICRPCRPGVKQSLEELDREIEQEAEGEILNTFQEEQRGSGWHNHVRMTMAVVVV
jgi:hypothetical protein